MSDSTELYEEHPEAFLPILEMWAESADEQVDSMLALLEETYDYSPVSVLDVGCGIGRHVIPFAERGLEAHGLDISPEYVARAEQRASEAGVADETAFFRHDMRDIDELTRDYELLVCVGTSFGYFDEMTNAALLETFHDRLAPGGVLIVEVNNKEGELAGWNDAGLERPGKDALHAVEYDYDPLTSRLHVLNVAIDEETVVGKGEVDVRLYTPIELRQLFETAGFSDVRLAATFDGESLTRESPRLLAMGRR